MVAVQETLTPTFSRKREKAQDASLREWEHDKPLQKLRARALRQVQTDAEALLWSKLRDRQILNLKFRRQRPIGPYFADFACLEIGLVIELDGGQHVGNAHDTKRSSDMQALGFQTLRFWNNDVLMQIDVVLEKIFQTAETLTLALSRTREREQDEPVSVPSPVFGRGLG
jgi:very-short-patch-repair endonuclease